MSAQQNPGPYTLSPYIMQSVLLLVAPALFAASIYMELGRIVLMVDGERSLFIRRTWLTKLFVAGDVLSFLMQSSGKRSPCSSPSEIEQTLTRPRRCRTSCYRRQCRRWRHGQQHHYRRSHRPGRRLWPFRHRSRHLPLPPPQTTNCQLPRNTMGEAHGLALYRQHPDLRPIDCPRSRVCAGYYRIHHGP